MNAKVPIMGWGWRALNFWGYRAGFARRCCTSAIALSGCKLKRKAMKKEYRPMLATLVDKPFDSEEWVYETKWDGFRLIAEVKRGPVRLFSRNGIEVTGRYPAIAQALRAVTEHEKSRH